MTKFYVYILACRVNRRDQSYYTGQTSRIAERTLEHMQGKGARYTKGRLPIALVYVEIHPTRGDAMRRELQIKSMTRKQKEELINTPHIVDWRKLY